MAQCEWCGRDEETAQHKKILYSRAVGYETNFKLSRAAMLCFRCSVGDVAFANRPESIYWEPQVVKRMVAEKFLLFAYSHHADFPTGTAETGGYHVLVPPKIYATLQRVVKLAKEIYAQGGNDLDTVALLKETWESEQGGDDATSISVERGGVDRGAVRDRDGVETRLAFEGSPEVDALDRETGD